MRNGDCYYYAPRNRYFQLAGVFGDLDPSMNYFDSRGGAISESLAPLKNGKAPHSHSPSALAGEGNGVMTNGD